MHTIARLFALCSSALALSAALTPAQGQSGKDRATACVACHGANGVSSIANTPSLAGQPEMYLQIQLVLFREKQRNVPEMQPFVDKLTDPDIQELAAYFSALPLTERPGEVDASKMARGKQIGERANCNSCHMPDYTGQNQMPRLAGQREDYLVKAMKEYRDGKRPGLDGTMTGVLRGMSDADVEAMAHFLARVK